MANMSQPSMSSNSNPSLYSHPHPPKRFQERPSEDRHYSHEGSKKSADPREDRSQHERPCRTLFVRNVNYETTETYLENLFRKFGEIKTFFSLVPTRGMIFVTYVREV